MQQETDHGVRRDAHAIATGVQVDARAIITDAEVADFRTNGFVIPKVGLPADDAAWMRGVIEKVFRDNPDWHGIVRMPHIPLREGQQEGVKGGEELFKIAIHPTLIMAASRLVGPNLIMWGGEIFAKPAGTGKRTPWHQDCYNPAVKAGPGRRLPQSAQIWIAVDDVDPDNGSLSFIAGSGREGPIRHEQHQELRDLLNFEVDRSGLQDARIVNSVLPSGHFSIHDLFVVHGANANTSGRRRAGLTFHYMAAEDVYDRSFGAAIGTGRDRPAPLAQRPIWLVLGENKVPQNDFVTGHQNLSDLDAMAEARRRELTPQAAA
ncbi:phytanoyl-CoA dioxygenase family protein [Niveispirillum fermenti]|uniref:phytanoyl-CoA dioxygenase family protein n=1 Tax=Niveispirillum fermenti TaxID=1233113 RepID=UPI003A8366B1